MKNHSYKMHTPICDIFCIHSVAVAHYVALIQAKSPTNCNAHLAESIFQKHSSNIYMEFIEELQEFLFHQGFRKIQYDSKILWGQEHDGTLSLLEIVMPPLRGQRKISLRQREEEMADIERQIMLKYQKKVEHLLLILSEEEPDSNARQEAEQYPDIWFLDIKKGRLYIYEYQKSKYCTLENSLESFTQKFLQKKASEERKELKRTLTPVNTALVAANIIVFAILCFLGDTTNADFMAAHGAMDWTDVVEKGQYYRLFTSMFLHFGAEHLLQNMLILLVIGCRLERITGKLSYLIIYIGSGLAGAATSIIFTLGTNPNTVSAGASGAIFGIMGGLLYCILIDMIQKKRHRVAEIGPTGMIFMVASALSYGFFSTGVDNAAHIGGLVGGFLLTMVISICKI